jgi:murein DD-endopeptidase MepM/ murein hydrolase activator NlpD
MAAAAAITVVVMAGDIFMHVQPDGVTQETANAPLPSTRAADPSLPVGEPQAADGPAVAPAVPAPAASAGDTSGPKRARTVPAGPGIGDQAPDLAAPAPKPVRTVHVGGQDGEPGAAPAPGPTPDFAAARGIPEDQKAAGTQAPASAVAAASPPVARELAERKSADSPSFGWPLRGRVIAGFGSSLNGVPNNGIDLAVPPGTDIRAADDGVVMNAEAAGSGNLVLLRHRNGFVTAYARAGTLLVKPGDKVRRGQVIAKSGPARDAGEPQLHFEIRRGATPVDPAQYLPPG